MNLFDQYVEKLLFELYIGSDRAAALKTTREIIQEIVACAQFDKDAVDDFLDNK